jgi:hypothetical protein
MKIKIIGSNFYFFAICHADEGGIYNRCLVPRHDQHYNPMRQTLAENYHHDESRDLFRIVQNRDASFLGMTTTAIQTNATNTG